MQEEIKKKILNATLDVFNRKGLKFTMDDIASALGMSKKTIYTVFSNKETMFYAMVDECFTSIKESERQVLEDATLDTVGKLRAILGVMPESYKDIDFGQLYSLKDRYPNIYREVENRLETGWETTIELLEQGMAEGKIRKVRIPVLKTMLEATLEQFFQRDVLQRNKISYHEALQEVVAILMDGILLREEAD